MVHSFLSSSLDGGEWSTLVSGYNTSPYGEKVSVTRWKEGWLGPRSGVCVSEKENFLLQDTLFLLYY
jgi:hypothetical protein